MTQVAGVLVAAGPWALALGLVLFGGWLVVTGKFIPWARHREVIELYEKQAERQQATIDTLNRHVAELMEHSRLAAQTWESIRREAGQP